MARQRMTKEELKEDFKQIPDMIIQSLMNGGGIGGALKSIGSMFGQDDMDDEA